MTDDGSDYHKSLIVLVIAMFSMATGVGFIVPLLPVYAETMGASGVWIGLIFAANPFFRAMLMVVFGSLSDSKGKKNIILGGLLGYMIVALGFVVATLPIHLFLLRMVQGLFSAMISPVARAYAGELSPANAEGKVMGTLNTGFFAGFAGGPIMGGLLADSFGFNVPFYAMAILSGVSILLVVIWLPEQKSQTLSVDQRPVEMIMDSLRLFRSDTVKGIVSLRSAVGMGHGIFSSLLPLFAQLALGLSSAQVGAIITIRSLTGAVLQRKCGQFADRYNRKWLALAGSLLAPVAFLLVPLARGQGHMMILSVIIGVGFGISVPASEAIAVEQGRKYGMGKMIGLVEMTRSFAMAIGSIAGGIALDSLGTDYAFVAAAGLSVSGVFIATWFLRAYTGTPAEAFVEQDQAANG